MHIRALLVVASAAITLSLAPGARANSAGDVNAVARQLFRAARAGSGVRVCRLMDRHMQRAVVREAQRNGDTATDCPSVEDKTLSLLNGALGRSYIVKTVVHRGRATLTVRNHVLAGRDLLIFVRVGKHWRLHDDIG